MQHPVSVNMRIKLVGKRFLGRLFCVVDLYIEGFVDHISCFFDGNRTHCFQHLCGDVSDGSCLARACVDLFVGGLGGQFVKVSGIGTAAYDMDAAL